jgi:hypothetical protein
LVSQVFLWSRQSDPNTNRSGVADDQLCEICGAYAPFGYGPPAHPQTIRRCGQHRLEGPVPRSQPDPVQMTINAWIEANWPTESDASMCRHCRRKSDDLIPLGHGTRPRIWVHIECADPYRAEIKRRAIVALGIRAA